MCAQPDPPVCFVLRVEVHRVDVQGSGLSEWSSRSRGLWLPTAWLTPPLCPRGASLESDRQARAKWAVTWFMGHSEHAYAPFAQSSTGLLIWKLFSLCSLQGFPHPAWLFAHSAPPAVKVTAVPLDCRRLVDAPSFAWISLSEYYVMRHLSSFTVIPERGPRFRLWPLCLLPLTWRLSVA